MFFKRHIICIFCLALSVLNTLSAQTLKEGLGDYFLIGCAVNNRIVRDSESKANTIVRTHFNSIVADNCMKPALLSPAENQWHWTDADAFVDFGQANNMVVIGHCLVWHSQTASWMFVGPDGKPASRELLISRMRTYIHTVVGRYKGRILGWDVCNECFNDDGTLRDSQWRQIIGDDYIELAFRFAHEADPDAELYYNDYSMSFPAKYTAVCKMVTELRAKGVRIDAIGMQSHNGLNWPKLSDYDKAMDAIAATGAKIIISELDLNVLPNPEGFSGAEVDQYFEYTPEMDPYAQGMDTRTKQIIYERWLAFFLLYRQHASQIERVTFWAVGDKDSWLADWPIKGRHTYATLFNRYYQPKSVIKDIIKLYNNQSPITNHQ